MNVENKNGLRIIYPDVGYRLYSKVSNLYYDVVCLGKYDREESYIEVHVDDIDNNRVVLKDIKDSDVISNMLAMTELFEMLLGIMPSTCLIDSVEGENIISVYVILVNNRIKDIEDIPVLIKDRVLDKLNELK